MTDLRPLGTTGLMTPPLILGGNVFGWTADEAAGQAVLDAFVAHGGRMIDTADVYSAWVPGHQGGESEVAIGRWIRARRPDVMITTKVGMLAGEGGQGLAPARIRAACEASLQRLGVETIDLYLAHRDDDAVPQEDVAETFDALVREGKVRHIGASNFTPERLSAALDVQATGGFVRYAVVQPWYSLVDRPKFEGGSQDLAVARGLAATPYYSLASGFLTGKYRTADDVSGTRAPQAGKYLNPHGLAVLDALDAVAGETGASLAAVALAWLARRPAVVAPIASATSVAQMEALTVAMHLTLTDDQMARLTAASDA